MHTLTYRLRWSDVRPEVRVFEPRVARPLIGQFFRRLKNLGHNEDGYWIEDQVDQVLVREFGVWIIGWRSAIDGGPVTAYDGLDTNRPRRSTNQVIAAVKQWQAFLQELDEVFAQFPIRTDEELPLQFELAANRLLTIVLRRSSAQDAWYNSCALSLQWYLESQERSTFQARRAISAVMSGSFSSWLEACPEQLAQVSEQAALTLASLPPEAERDATSAWIKIRKGRVWSHFHSQLDALRSDGHLRYIEQTEQDAAMSEALLLARRWAETNLPLDLETVRSWQKVVLGLEKPAEIRTVNAYAKAGRERYGVEHLPMLEECLMEANDASVDPRWRAAVAYLDLAFFHPFADGNARAARLVMDALLWRAGLALNVVEPAFVMARAAEDDNGPTMLAIQIDALVGRRSVVSLRSEIG